MYRSDAVDTPMRRVGKNFRRVGQIVNGLKVAYRSFAVVVADATIKVSASQDSRADMSGTSYTWASP